MMRLRPVMSERASRLGRYCSARAAAITLRRVSFATEAPGVKARLTADRLTPALRATSSADGMRYALLKREKDRTIAFIVSPGAAASSARHRTLPNHGR